MICEQLRQRVEQRIEECKQKTGVHVDVAIEYNVKGRYAGWAWHGSNGQHRVRFNADMLLAHTDQFIFDTVAHEYAHIAAFEKYGHKIKPHGNEWKHMMRSIGAEPKRCHDFPIPPKKTTAKAPKAVKAPRAGSKLSKCLELYVSYFDRYNRTDMINIFVYEADCTVQGANTYLSACKKLYTSGAW